MCHFFWNTLYIRVFNIWVDTTTVVGTRHVVSAFVLKKECGKKAPPVTNTKVYLYLANVDVVGVAFLGEEPTTVP